MKFHKSAFLIVWLMISSFGSTTGLALMMMIKTNGVPIGTRKELIKHDIMG